MRAIDTTDGQLTVGLIVKVEGEDRLLTSILGPHTGLRTDSTEKRPKPCRRFRRTFRESTTLQLQKRQSTAKVSFVMTHLLFASQSTVDVVKLCSKEELISLDLRTSSLDIPSRTSQILGNRRRGMSGVAFGNLSILPICVVPLQQFFSMWRMPHPQVGLCHISLLWLLVLRRSVRPPVPQCIRVGIRQQRSARRPSGSQHQRGGHGSRRDPKTFI